MGTSSTDKHHTMRYTVTRCTYSCRRADSIKYHMKICHHIDTTTKRARFLCPVHDCGNSFFHATHLIKQLSEHDIEIGICKL